MVDRKKMYRWTSVEEAAVDAAALHMELLPLGARCYLVLVELQNLGVPQLLLDQVRVHLRAFRQRKEEAGKAYRG